MGLVKAIHTTPLDGRLTAPVRDVATALSVAPSTVRDMMARGELRAIRINRAVRVVVDDVIRLVDDEGGAEHAHGAPAA